MHSLHYAENHSKSNDGFTETEPFPLTLKRSSLLAFSLPHVMMALCISRREGLVSMCPCTGILADCFHCRDFNMKKKKESHGTVFFFFLPSLWNTDKVIISASSIQANVCFALLNLRAVTFPNCSSSCQYLPHLSTPNVPSCLKSFPPERAKASGSQQNTLHLHACYLPNNLLSLLSSRPGEATTRGDKESSL